MFTVPPPRYRFQAGPRRLARQRFHRRPELERLEDRWVLALSAFEIVLPGSVETATPDVVVSAPAEITSPLLGMEDFVPEVEPFEGQRLLSRGLYPDLPEMLVVDPSVGPFDSQVFHLDFDGARDVTYRGPVVVEGIDVPSFRLPDELAGQEQVVIDGLVEKIEETFVDTRISFTTQQPTAGEYSTVYIGGDGAAFQDYGNFDGLAERIDVGNEDHADAALVFSDRIMGGERREALPEVIIHEIGHLLGYAHEGDDAGVASDLADVAHEAVTHVFITQQASILYKALFGVAEVDLEFFDYLVDPPETDSADDGNSVVEGVKEEDAYNLLEFRFKNHFSEGGDGGELYDGLLGYDSAYTTAAVSRFPTALSEHIAGNTSSAYWWFGRALHLLQDATVPAHVHNDAHITIAGIGDPITGDDQYEKYVTPGTGSNYHEYFRFDTTNGDSWNFQDWANGYWSTPASVMILGSSPQALWDRSDNYASLGAIFRETTDYTDDYDSDDYYGDCRNGTSGDGFPLDRLDEMDRDRSTDPSMHRDWACNEVINPGVFDRDLEPGEVSKLARDVGTWAVEQSALLMRYYYDALGEVVSSPTNMHTDRIGTGSIELGWDGVEGAEGYVVYRSDSPDTGYSWVGSSSEPNYQDTTLDLDTTYDYRVYAYSDVAGLGSGYASVSATMNPSDINGDGAVDCDDVNLLTTEIATGGTNLEDYDFNDDGEIQLADLNEWLAMAGQVNLGPGISYLAGDANLDAIVDVSDFNNWNSNKFTGLGDGGGGGLWCRGDFNADGSVDLSDLHIWNENKFTTSLQLTLDFDAQPLGSFSNLQESGFTLDYIGFGDLQAVVDSGDGDLVLVDSDPQNPYGAEIVIRRTDGLTFFLDSLYASDLTNDPTTLWGRIDVRGLSDGTWVETQLTPTSSSFTQYTPAPFVGLELDQLHVNLVGSPLDNFSVDDITLTVAPAEGVHNGPPTLMLDPVSTVEIGLATLSGTIHEPRALDTITPDMNSSEPRELASVDGASDYDRLFSEPVERSHSSPLMWRSPIGRSDLDFTGDRQRQYSADERSDRNQEERDMMADLDTVFAFWKV